MQSENCGLKKSKKNELRFQLISMLGERCIECGETDPAKLQFHHLITNGDHSKGNIIRLCKDCHYKLHQIYDEQVRTRIKVEVAKIKQDLIKSKENRERFQDLIKNEIRTQMDLVHNKFADLKKDIIETKSK